MSIDFRPSCHAPEGANQRSRAAANRLQRCYSLMPGRGDRALTGLSASVHEVSIKMFGADLGGGSGECKGDTGIEAFTPNLIGDPIVSKAEFVLAQRERRRSNLFQLSGNAARWIGSPGLRRVMTQCVGQPCHSPGVIARRSCSVLVHS